MLQTNIEIMKEDDFTRILELEEQYVQKICEDIIRIKPDVVFTEKGVSDLAQHYLVKVTIIRRHSCFAFYRLSIISTFEGWNHSSPPRKEIGQQPHRSCLWCDDRQPYG
jgi:hypothetical protein